ncbi:MAG: hypothetical protein ACREGK_01785 [Geminicoccales bacterium]
MDAEPEDIVEVTLDAGHIRKVDELPMMVREIGAEAARRGLTDQKLDELLP